MKLQTKTLSDCSVRLLRQWAFSDDLTGISNRRHLGLVASERRALDQTTYYVAIDLNGFKAAQDRPGRGHGWGDRILKRFARFLLSSTRQRRWSAEARDVVLGRPGGDEFLVIAGSKTGAESIARRVRAWSSMGVGASAGVGVTWRSADRALYVEKRARQPVRA